MASSNGRAVAAIRLYVRILLSTGISFGVLMGLIDGVTGNQGITHALVRDGLMGLVFGLGMSLLLGSVALLSTRGAGGAALHVRQSRTLDLPGGRENALRRVTDAICALPGAGAARVDPHTGIIKVRKGLSWKSWGEVITACVESVGPDVQRVTIESRSSFRPTVVDYGANAANVAVIREALVGSTLGAGVTARPKMSGWGVVLPVLGGLCGAAIFVFVVPAAFLPPRHVAAYTREDYEKAVHELAAAKDRLDRAYALVDAAKTTVYFGSLDDAQRYATELLAFVKEDTEKGRRVDGNAIHDGHEVLGLVALRQGRVEDAKKELLLAGGTPGSPPLDTFGPNMLLAKELLEHGEAAAVIQYFDLCRRFWKMERGRLDQWTRDARAGRDPAFGANLVF